jgi:16S rRNA (adenine(1408)-N(1))-methyltransferase
VVVDVGTGDGRFVLRTAAADPASLVVGIDADQAGLRAGYSKARRQRLDNTLFVVAGAEHLPAALAGRADEVHVQFPWGSLLRALLLPDPDVVRGLAHLAKPGGAVTLRLSITAHDGVAGMEALDAIGAQTIGRRVAAASDALVFGGARPVTPDEAKRLHSSWAARLRVGHSREAWTLRFHRVAEAATAG